MEREGGVQHDGHFFDNQYSSCNLGSMANVREFCHRKKLDMRPPSALWLS
jgi:hypothetical protein